MAEGVKINKGHLLLRQIKRHKGMYLLIFPGFVLLIIFHYLPMYGILLAFKDYNFSEGILGSKWVGLKYFKMIFDDAYFIKSLRNTLIISGLKLFVGFPVPVIFALLLNEVTNMKFKRISQTLSYLPYFVSWVILSGIFLNLFSPEGPINYVRGLFGQPPVLFFAVPKYFLTLLIVTYIWRDMGWGAIIYLASLTNIDPHLYEAAYIDGAGRWKQTIHITIPSILPVVVIMLILNTGFILSAGFDQIFNLSNPMVMDVAEIIDTYVYRKGLVEMNFSYATAVGFFKSFVGFVLIFITNRIAVALGGRSSSLW